MDFDGTITMRDTLHVIVDEHGRDGVWDALEPDLRAGRITIEQAMSRQFSEVKAAPDEIFALVRERAGVRDGILELVEFAEQEGHRLVIMSAGFRSVIDQVLGDLGLQHLEVVPANRWRCNGRCARNCSRQMGFSILSGVSQSQKPALKGVGTRGGGSEGGSMYRM